ncbi:receptor-transporting protein 2-like [Plectropomus leopardus]|uniref:receptor-transporting protein 2-like n=1 Tax=Plectropomus leopardus TaxID=160734 RepID=UPI001C4BDED0|nr:receptor-transporting protein 2-like [Plectropomus leopardus]
MAQFESQWTNLFRIKANNLRRIRGDSWRLETDESIVPDRLNAGWMQCIKNTSARFNCTCWRAWPSNVVTVVFHMHLENGKGVVKVRPLNQGCNNCKTMVKPSIDDDNIDILLDNLVEKIRIQCYDKPQRRGSKSFIPLDIRSQHEPSLCQACQLGICGRS